VAIGNICNRHDASRGPSAIAELLVKYSDNFAYRHGFRMFLLQKIIDGITLQSRMEFLARCIVVFVMLMQNAPIVREWVGLRPVRKTLRIEHEVMKFPSGSLQVPIHCDALFGLLVAQDFTL